MNSPSPIITIHDLKAESDFGSIGDLNPLHLQVAAGDVLSILGGKMPALLFRLLLGMGSIKSGNITFDGEEWAPGQDYPRWFNRIGIGLRSDGLLSNMTLQDNLLLPLRYHDMFSETERTSMMAVQMQEAQIDEKYWGLRPHGVPWEVRKRALLARSCIMNPKLLLLDSPTELLAWESLPWLRQWIKRQSERGIAIMMGTENIPLAMSLTENFYAEQLMTIGQVGEHYWGQDWQSAKELFLQHWGQK